MLSLLLFPTHYRLLSPCEEPCENYTPNYQQKVNGVQSFKTANDKATNKKTTNAMPLIPNHIYIQHFIHSREASDLLHL